MKCIARLLLCAAVVLALAGGAASAAARPDEGGFTISDYDVHAIISENNVYNITETIQVNFTAARHGIVRDIPINQTLKRVGSDGNEYDTKVKSTISGVSVKGYKYSVSSTPDKVSIKIGDANKTVTGEQTYVISYKLRFFDDGVSAFDEAYINIIGTDWDTTIDRVSFSMELPKAFDKNGLGFSMGSAGKSGYDPDKLKFSVEGSTVSGYTTGQMRNYEALTMRLELPQGYFNVPDPRLPDWLIMGGTGLMCLISILLFLILGIDYKPVQTVEFNAPPGMTPTDVGYIVDGCVDDRDVTSLIMYWADRGCLRIDDLGDDNFRLTKLKDLPAGSKDYERYMFEKLFKKGDSIETDDLQNKFYKTVAAVQEKVPQAYTGKSALFTKASLRAKPLLGLLTIVPVIMTMILEAYRGTHIMTPSVILGIVVGLLMLLPVFLMIHVMRTWKLHSPTSRGVMLVISLALWAGASAFFITHTQDNIHTQLPWVAVLGTTLIALCAVFIRKRTRQSAEWYAKIMAFREFITLAERDRIVTLVEQNPSYFYNVLPYAYVMNVTDKWAEKFVGIAMEQPQWYTGLNMTAFSSTAFTHSMSASMAVMHSSMLSSPSSSSSGGGGSGFSSGSSSGGGGGGGGGGSW